MHELSIAASMTEAVTEAAAAYPRARVVAVRLRVGALAAVAQDSLQFSWNVTTENTPLAGAALVVQTLPVIVHCAGCDQDRELRSIENLCCPQCGALSADLRQGRELEIESIELEEAGPEEAEREEAEIDEAEIGKPEPVAAAEDPFLRDPSQRGPG